MSLKLFAVLDSKTKQLTAPTLADDANSIKSLLVQFLASNPGTNLELFAGDYSVVVLGELQEVLSLPSLPLSPTFDTICNLSELIPFVSKVRDDAVKAKAVRGDADAE